MVKLFERLYAWGLLIVFAGIIIHTPLTLWLGTVYPESALLMKSWKEILIVLLVPMAVWLVTQRGLWRELSVDWIFRLIIAFAGLHILLAVVWWHGATSTFAGLAIDLRYILFFALVYTLIRVLPQYKKMMICIAVGGALVITGFATLQYFLPADILAHIGYSDQTIKPYQTVDENSEYVRVNSTLRGPNPLGAYAAATLAMTAAFIIRRLRQQKNKKVFAVVDVVGLCSVVALWLSYSRSAIVAALIGVATVVAVSMKKVSRNMVMTIGIVAVIMIAVGIVARDSSFVQNVILHDNPTTGATVTSNDAHVDSLRAGLDRMVAQPFGVGIGSTGSASLLGENGVIIENQYLFVAHESGWLGLMLYLCLFGLVMWRLFGLRKDWLPLGVFASGVTLALIGILLPVWADDTVSIVWWGLAAIAIGGAYGKNTKSK